MAIAPVDFEQDGKVADGEGTRHVDQEGADGKIAVIVLADTRPVNQRSSDPRPPPRPTHITSNGVIPATPVLNWPSRSNFAAATTLNNLLLALWR